MYIMYMYCEYSFHKHFEKLIMNYFSVEIKIIFKHKEQNYGNIHDGGYNILISNNLFL